MNTNPTPPCTKCGQPHIAHNGHPGCNGHNRAGNPCGKQPMDGLTVCRAHGGASPHVIKAAERRKAMHEAAVLVGSFGYGDDRKVSPAEAIMEELQRSANSVAWLTMIIAEIEKKDLVRGATKVEVRSGFQPAQTSTVEVKPSVWYELWHRERKHYAQVADIAHRMGIDERQTQVIEGAASLLVKMVADVLGRLELSEAQQALASSVVPEVLRGIATSQGTFEVDLGPDSERTTA